MNHYGSTRSAEKANNFFICLRRYIRKEEILQQYPGTLTKAKNNDLCNNVADFY